MKKTLALALALCLVLAALPASALELLSGKDTYPIQTDKTVSFYCQSNLNPHEKFKDWHESPFHNNLIKMTGINIDWMFPTTGTDGGVFTNTLIADPTNLPDIMGVHWMDNAAMYLEDEVIWDLTPYIQEYAPAYYAFLQTNPAYDRAMKTDDGQYYAFNFFREDGGWNDTYLGPVVRTDWLEECGLEEPKTISEFNNVIKVFNEKYGAKFSFAWSRFNGHGGGLAGAFGAYTACSNTYYVHDGKVNYAMAQPEWRTYMQWLVGLWNDGLLDQDIMTLDDTSIKAKIHNDQCGISITSMGQLNNWNKERMADGKEPVWKGIGYPTGDDGTLANVFGGFGISDWTFVITKCADEDTMKLALQLLDYAYTQEGFLFWNYGVEGESWTMGENGVPQYTDLVKNDTDTDPQTKYGGATWGACCIQATNLLYLKNSQAAIEANDTWFYNYPDDEEKNLAVTGGWKWPNGITFTLDESDELDLIAGGISTYASEAFAAFLTGTKDINSDADWDNYIAGYETHNLSRVLEIRQDAYDRYLAR